MKCNPIFLYSLRYRPWYFLKLLQTTKTSLSIKSTGLDSTLGIQPLPTSYPEVHRSCLVWINPHLQLDPVTGSFLFRADGNVNVEYIADYDKTLTATRCQNRQWQETKRWKISPLSCRFLSYDRFGGMHLSACLLQQVGRPTKGVRINAQPTTFLPHYDTSPIRLQYSPYCVVKEPILQDERGSIATQ